MPSPQELAQALTAPTQKNDPSLLARTLSTFDRDPAFEYGNILPFRKPLGAIGAAQQGGSGVQWGLGYSNLAKSLYDAFNAPSNAAQGQPQTPEDAMNFALASGIGGMAVGRAPQGALGMNSYRGSHKPPSPTYGAPLHDLTAGDLIPADIYSNMAARYYGTGDAKMDAATLKLFQEMRGKPEASISIYRAVPKDAPSSINAGDWVTINRNYADLHGNGPLLGDYKIIEKKVPAKSLWTSLDSIHEFGYHPD